jgi:dTMP kinase
MKGLLITFEGIDGSGKSTQAVLLKKHLEELGLPVNFYREPGGTVIGEKIRSILLDKDHSDMQPLTELFLYLAARAQITAQLISPSLDKGYIVIMDRYLDSTIAYQGYARGLGMDRLRELNLIATEGLLPDATFIIDCDPHVALTRLTSLPDRLESEGVEFMKKVREGFLLLAEKEPARITVVDGARDVSSIKNEIFQKVKNLIIKI